jgi:uncharacterized membrane protein
MPGIPYHDVGHPSAWWFLWGMVPIVLLAGLVVVGVVLLLRPRPSASGGAGGGSGPPPPTYATASRDPALDALRLRYARGEVDRDGYLSAATDLGAFPATPASGPTVPAAGDVAAPPSQT